MKKDQIQKKKEAIQGAQGTLKRVGEPLLEKLDGIVMCKVLQVRLSCLYIMSQQVKVVQEKNNTLDVFSRNDKTRICENGFRERNRERIFIVNPETSDFCNWESLKQLRVNEALYVELNGIQYCECKR